MARTQTFTLFQSSVATSFAGGVFLDCPVKGNVVAVQFNMSGIGNAANVSEATAELSRVTVDQSGSATGKGIIAAASNTALASNYGAASNLTVSPLAEPVNVGERLYLHFRNAGANWVHHSVTCNITIQVA